MPVRIIQTAKNDATGAAATIVTSSITVTAGSVLHVYVTCASDKTITSVTDPTNGNYGASLDGTIDMPNAGQHIAQFRFENAAAGTYAITANYQAGASFRGIYVVELIEAASPAIDGHTGKEDNSPGTGANAIDSGTTSNSNNPAVVLGFCFNDAGSVAATVGTGFTNYFDTIWSTIGLSTLEYKRITSSGSQQSTFTADSSEGTNTYAALVAIYDEAGPSVIQDKTTFTASSSTTVSVTLTGVRAGSTIHVVTGNGTSNPTVTVADDVNAGNYTQQGSTINFASTAKYFRQFNHTDSAAGTVVITATFGSATTNRRIYAAELANGCGIIDGVNGAITNSPPGTFDNISSGTATNTQQPALLLGYCESEATASAATEGTDWFTPTGLVDSDGSAFAESKNITTTSARDAVFSTNVGTNYAAFVAIYRQGTAGPTINTQPTSLTKYSGETATFSVSATTSGGSLTYQWRRNTVDIGGATSSSFVITYVGNDDHLDLFDCTVTDDNGSVTTNKAQLFVIHVGQLTYFQIN